MAGIDVARESWGERIPGDPDRLLPWLAGLADAERMELLALCVAVNLNDVHDDEKAGPLDPLCAMLGLDIADWWEAKKNTYFQRVNKDQLSQAITEAAGPDVVARYKGRVQGRAGTARRAGLEWQALGSGAAAGTRCHRRLTGRRYEVAPAAFSGSLGGALHRLPVAWR